MSEELNMMIDTFRSFNGEGMLLALYVAALIYIYVKDRKKAKNIFFYPSAMMVVLIFSPLAIWVLEHAGFDMEVLWRSYWILPLAALIAYVGTDIIFAAGTTRKKRGVTVCLLVVLLIVSGRFVFTPNNFTVSGNLYKIPQEVIAISDILTKNAKEPKAVFPNELLPYVRQYDATIKMPYGRNALKALNYEIPMEIYEPINAEMVEEIDVDALRNALEATKTEFMVLKDSSAVSSKIDELGAQYIDQVEDYYIYRLNIQETGDGH